MNSLTEKKKKLPRAQREQQLLNTALDLFITKGYQGTTIEDIAEAAGVSRPVIYDHFGVKDNVYLACLRRARENLDDRLASAPTGDRTFEDALHTGIDNYFQFVEHDRQAWHLLFGGGAAVAGTAEREATDLRFATVNKIADMLAQFEIGVERTVIEMQAHALSGAAEQLAKWWIENGQVERKVVVAWLFALLLPGFERQMHPR